MIRNFAALLVAVLLPCAALAHEDRAFPIAADGTLRGTPERWGAIRLDLDVDETKAIASVVLSTPHFRTRLDRCLIDLMKSSALTEVTASGSWYHDRSRLPPYVALEVRRKGEATMFPAANAMQVVVSMDDGSIVSGVRRWTTWWGGHRSKIVEQPGKCSGWR